MKRSLAWLLVPALAALAIGPGHGAPQESLQPINISGVNTAADEDDPHVSSSALQLFYTSTAKGKSEVMVSSRRPVDPNWPAGKPVVELQGKADYRSVFLTPDGRYPQLLYFATNKDPETGGKGDNFDIYFLMRQGPRADFTTETSVNAIDTPADELDPWLTADGRSLYFSRKDEEGWHIYVSSRPPRGGQFGAPVRVKFPPGFRHPTLTPDGRTMYLQGPLEKERSGLFRATFTAGGWSEPEPLEGLNNAEGPTGDRSPCLNRDGSKLYFASDRPGGKGGLDLWVIATTLLKQK